MMIEQFAEYLDAIRLPEVHRGKVERALGVYECVCPDRHLQRIFVTDYVGEEPTRVYQKLWLFSPNYLMEAQVFVTEEEYDIITIKRKIIHLFIELKDFDFREGTAGPESRMKVTFRLGNNLSGELKASSENCGYLKTIVENEFVPNLVKPEE